MPTTLKTEHEALVERIVASGRYADADEVIGEALRQLDERAERLVRFRAAVAIGEEQIARGQVVEWTPALHASIMADARAAAGAGETPKPDVCP